MKKLLSLATVSLSLLTPLGANAAPRLGYGVANTPYGNFGCKQRAEGKLFSIGATNIQRSGNSSTIWAYYGNFSIGVWCRGPEALILVGGDSDTLDLIEEIKLAF